MPTWTEKLHMLILKKLLLKYDMTKDEKLTSFDSDEKTYSLIKFRKTNQGTCINLKSNCSKGGYSI